MQLNGDEILGGIDALVEDRIRGESTDTTQGEEVRTFDQLLTDAKRELFPNYTLLKFVIEVFNMKVTNHWSNKSVDMMLEFLSRLLPKENLVPKSTYEAKKILRDLGLSYDLIHACINDCVLFWKENATLDKCPTCKTSRYKINCGRGKKIPHKVLRYFPLTPRLKRLYMSRKRAEMDPFSLMSLLIPGESQLGIDIDVYMRPLVDELNDLWTNGHYSCYTCNDKPYFESLRSKTGYTNHRCYLPEDRPERRKSRAYNGKIEKRKRSLELPVEKIQDQLDNVKGVIYGKHPSNRKRPRQAPNWTKVSILYELPYWKKQKLQHNIDVMHVEKNFSENVSGSIDGKNKDTDKARLDLEDMGIRKELWLTQRPDGSYVKPRAIFSLTPADREGFFEFLKTVKYPDGYAANISKSVNARNGTLTGIKSHDCHVLIQRILPIGIRGYVDREISTTLVELGNFFQDLCSRTLRRSELEKLEKRIIHILCKLEKIFPPAFFDVMIHLAVHLPREAILGGPVQYRWMYPIERACG
ncbi:uncharacterized protein LOC114294017 [Camellia sinensis]|uniref:uncharacterized protein LOC114294017 n=1 Tax=Camellia sinensis TaxID=4442 RepID=UPI001035B099|nr:uncharacterized protein LOC114294017 [Camellia sinensis]